MFRVGCQQRRFRFGNRSAFNGRDVQHDARFRFNEKPRFRPVFAQSSKRVDREIVVVLQLKNQDARPQAGDRANRFVDVREILHPDTGNLAKVELRAQPRRKQASCSGSLPTIAPG